jgi:hypothetical protein
MAKSIEAEIALLRGSTVAELCVRYVEVYGEDPRNRHRDYLWKRIAYRIQELAEGGISERALRRAAELARDADLRLRPPSRPNEPASSQPLRPGRDPRLPPAGTRLTRVVGDTPHVVQAPPWKGQPYGGFLPT